MDSLNYQPQTKEVRNRLLFYLTVVYLYIKTNMKNIIISEKQLEKLTNRVKNSLTENQEEGSYMAKQQLFTIATLAHKMWEEMEDGEQLEDWMETKIAQSEQSIISVVKTFMYDEVSSKTSNDGMGKLSFDDLIIGK